MGVMRWIVCDIPALRSISEGVWGDGGGNDEGAGIKSIDG